MGEIKGQLLGVVLVISIFAIVAGILTTAFRNSANTVSDQVENAVKTSSKSSGAGAILLVG